MEIHLFFDRVKLAFEFFVRTNERTLEERIIFMGNIYESLIIRTDEIL